MSALADKQVRWEGVKHAAAPHFCSAQVIAVGAGSSTSYAVTAEGQGYAWGFGENLQLTNGEEKDELLPILMSGQQLDGRRVLQVRGGGGGRASMGLTPFSSRSRAAASMR